MTRARSHRGADFESLFAKFLKTVNFVLGHDASQLLGPDPCLFLGLGPSLFFGFGSSRFLRVGQGRGAPGRKRAPLAVSRSSFPQPAARNCFTCASTLWPSAFIVDWGATKML